MPKILGICGSPRIANTDKLVKTSLYAANELEGIRTEFIRLLDYDIKRCNGCLKCLAEKCPIMDDMEALNEKLIDGDAILIGSATYWHNVPGILKDFMDRTIPIYYGQRRRRPWKKLLKGKLGAGITLSIATGHEQVLSIIDEFFDLHEMVRLDGIALATQVNLDFDIKKTLGKALSKDMLGKARTLGRSIAKSLVNET